MGREREGEEGKLFALKRREDAPVQVFLPGVGDGSSFNYTLLKSDQGM